MGKASTSMWLVAAGVLLVLCGLAFQVYPLYGQWRHSLSVVPPITQEIPTSQPAQVLKPTPTTPLPSPVPTNHAPADYGLPIWMTIPSIEVNAQVVEAPIEDGAYTVPLYDVGHHQGSPSPAQPGNSAYVGHVDTISAGQVFARLKDISIGDVIYIYTDSHETTWIVSDISIYENDDSSFLAQTTQPQITLYTCHGTFDWATRDFSHRLVVTGDLQSVQDYPVSTQMIMLPKAVLRSNDNVTESHYPLLVS